MASEIKVDTIVNAGGDNDSGIDLSTNDQVKIKIAGSTDLTFKANEIENSSGDLTLDVAGDISLDANGQQIFFKKDGTTFGQVQTEATPANFTFESAVSDGDIIFKGSDGGSGIEAMRIDMSAGGNLGINTTSPVTKLHVNADTNDLFCLERSGKSSGSGFAGFNIETNSQFTIAYDDGADLVIGTASDPSTQSGFTNHFKIASDGTLTATDTSIGSISDERLKKNIVDYTYDLEKFKQYKPKTFDWKNPSNHNGKTGNRGFLAQDVKSIDDKWVGEFEITEKNPDYGIISGNVSLTSKLGDKDTMYISIIQQLITKVETLEAKVSALESK